jgi:PAS domain S-box-containing protein
VTPSLFTRRQAARALGYLFLGGSAIVLATLLLPHDEMVRDGPLFALTGATAAIGAAILRRAGRAGEMELHAALAAGSLILGAANYFVGPTATFPLIYCWTALYAFTFFALRAALLHLALIGVSYFVVLLAQDDPASPVVRWLLVVGTPLVVGVLISRILELAATRTQVLRESEARTRAIVQGAPDAFASIETDGTVVAWNREAQRVFGVPEEKAIGRDVGELMFAPEDRAAHVERRTRDFERPAGEMPTRREVEMARGDGTKFPAEITVSRIKADGRTLLAFFVRDVSVRRQREREREELMREQAAREEAEQMASIVHGLQVLLDAALAHSRLDHMLDALLPRLCEVLTADAASVLLTGDDGSLVLQASTGELPGPEEDPIRAHVGEGIAGRVAQSMEPEIANDPAGAEVADPALRSCGSVLGVPLLAGGAVTGVILVGVPPPRRFIDDDLLLLALAGDRVALAIEHARVFEREHRIAETLQRSLLPDRLPALPGLEVAARYLPAASEAEVGGDWYDVIPIAAGRVGLVMGDVAGKGLAAASMVGRLRSALRAYALEGHDAPTVVARLNDLVWSEVGDSEMATLAYVVIDPAENTVSWVNAGHLPPLVIDPDGSTVFLEGPGAVPLGVMSFPSYTEETRRLPAGATVLLYTDGLVERPGELLDTGLERLATAALRADDGPEHLCDGLVRGLLPAGAASDDVALLALHSPPLGDRFNLQLTADAARLASMRALLRRWLRHVDATDSELGEILIAAGEAAANAIEHGSESPDRHFQVSGSAAGGEVELTVTDTGNWRPSRADGRGRGLVMMRALMDEVEVSPGPEGTTVRMRRTLRLEDRVASG